MEAHKNWHNRLEMTMEVELARHPFTLPTPALCLSFPLQDEFCSEIPVLYYKHQGEKHAMHTI